MESQTHGAVFALRKNLHTVWINAITSSVLCVRQNAFVHQRGASYVASPLPRFSKYILTKSKIGRDPSCNYGNSMLTNVCSTVCSCVSSSKNHSRFILWYSFSNVSMTRLSPFTRSVLCLKPINLCIAVGPAYFFERFFQRLADLDVSE